MLLLAAATGLLAHAPAWPQDRLVTRLEVESLIPLGEDRARWMIPPGGYASTGQFLCTVQFDAPAEGIAREQVEIVQAVPQGLVYVPDSATGPGTLIELSSDDGETFLPPSDLEKSAAEVTHIRWLLAGPLPPGLRGRVSFRVELAQSPSPSVANQ